MLTGPHFSADDGARNLASRLEETRTRIASAAMRYGRSPDSVRLVAVSKAQPAAAIRVAHQCGQRDFGENYVQEAGSKLTALADLDLIWHFIGQLQANKTRTVAERFQWAHTLDRERIAVRLSEQRPAHAPPLNVCIQVSLGAEAGKGGVARDELLPLATRIAELPRLKLRGLMCIPPPGESFDEQRALFATLASCQRELVERGFALDTLSMGMSADLEAAIAEGATCVRVGTAIFGERPARGSKA
jgi:pyridoxal phosphate enzyme (YggS family)